MFLFRSDVLFPFFHDLSFRMQITTIQICKQASRQIICFRNENREQGPRCQTFKSIWARYISHNPLDPKQEGIVVNP